MPAHKHAALMAEYEGIARSSETPWNQLEWFLKQNDWSIPPQGTSMLTNEETYAETRAREAGEEARERAYADLHDEFEALYEAADLRTEASDGYSLEDVIECETDGMDEIYKALMSDEARDALVKKCIHLHCMKGVENVSSR